MTGFAVLTSLHRDAMNAAHSYEGCPIIGKIDPCDRIGERMGDEIAGK
jgi:hypothetical protein